MILVVGATGDLGGAITRRLLAQSHSVRALVRQGSPHQPLVDAGAQPIFGDLKDPASLATACQGIETLITTANSARRGDPDTVENVDLTGNRNLIDAAKAAGVKHFIFVSAVGADPNHPAPFMQAKGMAEQRLVESGIQYTILVPNAFMEVWPAMVVGMPVAQGQPVTLVGEGRRRHSFVSAADVMAFAAASVGNPRAINQRLIIGGPEALSWRDVVATYERVLGREIPMRFVAPGEPVPGLPGHMPQLLAGMEMYDTPMDMSELAPAFGIRLTSLEEFVRRSMAGAA